MIKRNRYSIKTKELIVEPEDVNDVWEGIWNIYLRGDQLVQIGTATFKGEKVFGAVPVSICLKEEYCNKGYGTIVFGLLVDFAFGYKNIYEVKAVTESDNDKCIYALEKAGFVRRDKEGKIETYSIIKPKSVWMSVYLYIGLIIGLVLGIVIGIMWVGLVIGLIIGLFIGAIMDSEENKERRKALGERA